MLRTIYVIKEGSVLYKREYGKALSDIEFNSLIPDITNSAFSAFRTEFRTYDYFRYKISFIAQKHLNLIFVMTTNISDDLKGIELELKKFRTEFLDLFGNEIDQNLDAVAFEVLDPLVDGIHRSLKPKISLVGYSGVGKTTISQLIRANKIPLEHIPTMNGEVATVKIGKFLFFLWDFAGQEQFSLLWNKFIKGSDAVLLITDSTLNNIEKSKFFLELIAEETPYAHSAIIANKQDLPNALELTDIERILGIKSYTMVALNPENRNKMIQIIADILEMNVKDSPLLRPLFERNKLVESAEKALENADFEKAADYFEKIAEKCIEIGDDRLGNKFYLKSNKIKQLVS